MCTWGPMIGLRSLGPGVSDRGCRNLTDVALADEDTNSIPTDYAIFSGLILESQ